MPEPKWFPDAAVGLLHSYLLDLFGGAEGIRDEGGLASALAHPKHLFAYSEPSIFELATTYISGIIRNHLFVDGNKRTGLAIGLSFLEENKYMFQATEAEATSMTIALAASEIDETSFAAWLSANCKETQ